jgi:hypothetical protein
MLKKNDLLSFMGNNDTRWAAIPRPVVMPVQGWLPTGCRVVGLGEALQTLSKINPVFETF